MYRWANERKVFAYTHLRVWVSWRIKCLKRLIIMVVGVKVNATWSRSEQRCPRRWQAPSSGSLCNVNYMRACVEFTLQQENNAQRAPRSSLLRATELGQQHHHHHHHHYNPHHQSLATLFDSTQVRTCTHTHASLKHIFQRMTNKSYGNNFVYFILKQSMIMPFWLFITYAYMAPVYWKTCKLFRRQSRLLIREIKTFHWHTVDIRNNIYQDSFRL